MEETIKSYLTEAFEEAVIAQEILSNLGHTMAESREFRTLVYASVNVESWLLLEASFPGYASNGKLATGVALLAGRSILGRDYEGTDASEYV